MQMIFSPVFVVDFNTAPTYEVIMITKYQTIEMEM